MAKYRHRVFEMYEFRDEAVDAISSKTASLVTTPGGPESWTLKHLDVSPSEGVTHISFKGSPTFGEATVSSLREDLAQLADRLPKDSKVLMDFAGVKSLCKAAVDELVLFNQKLRYKGSRIVLCCLDSSARESFFDVR